MVQVIKKVKIDGITHETTMSFSDGEWQLIQKHYPKEGVSFEQIERKTIPDLDKPGRAKDDDKPQMRDYNDLKDKAMDHFRKEEWEKAKYYFEECRKLKSFGWLNGKINQCVENLKEK